MTDKVINANDAKIIQNVYKEEEFDQFIKLVKGEDGGLPETWELTARALGVHRNTIENWRKRPEFRKAKADGIKHCIKEMQRAGKDDWRQWEASLTLLGAKEELPSTYIDNRQVTLNVSDELVEKFIGESTKKRLEELTNGGTERSISKEG